MDIKRSGSQLSAKRSSDYFTGTVRIDPLFQAARRAASRHFQPSIHFSNPSHTGFEAWVATEIVTLRVPSTLANITSKAWLACNSKALLLEPQRTLVSYMDGSVPQYHAPSLFELDIDFSLDQADLDPAESVSR